ncbi:hypothetical protein POP72_023 [Pectobacterium phage POP72]|uniref:Uncharacterized protein n=2 Tax=Axomammavirus PP1 TaxID=2733578 RepID=I7FWJ7_9CAUD|nr:hypothetical protein F486_gp21 [Pectobacterium phage PP1]AFP33684.1 hypothetical protein PP1_021 [Pectobacterium phage PP1]ARB10939.1 hypothetical protein POP72_023 [Pectobacterium phage POP72]
MKVQSVTIIFQHGKGPAGNLSSTVTYEEGNGYEDLHYIVREGQHVVNFTTSTGRREGRSVPAFDVKQVNTVLS